MSIQHAASALNRFGLGGRPNEMGRVSDARDWLLAQLQYAPLPTQLEELPTSLDYLGREAEYLRQRRDARQAPAADDSARAQADRGNLYRQSLATELERRYEAAVATDHGFSERLVHFWSNHFAISIDKRVATLYAAPMEREAIRPHVLGRFEDLLIAAVSHPGMLRYLDNVRSIGNDSAMARRTRQRNSGGADARSPGLNENLAREILELHTLGVDGGYAQDDVLELARSLTGWGVPAPQQWLRGRPDAAFVFRPAAHASGPRKVLGKVHAQAGVEQGCSVLRDLARHPATARHLSWKLARHLVADEPPEALVTRMARAWIDSSGDLPSVYRSLLTDPLAWSADARKFRTPHDFVIAALRASGVGAQGVRRAQVGMLARLGQPPFSPRSPAGFADELATWSGPDALWKRVQAAQGLAEAAPATRFDLLAIAGDSLGPGLDAETASALRRAESPRDGLALLYASPAFQWRQ